MSWPPGSSPPIPASTSPVHAPLKDAVEAAFGHELGWLLKA